MAIQFIVRLICTHDIFLRGRSLLPRLAVLAVVGLLVPEPQGSVGKFR